MSALPGLAPPHAPPVAVAAGLVLHLAKGFGRPANKPRGAEPAKDVDNDNSADLDVGYVDDLSDREVARARKQAKKMRGMPAPCRTCRGKGKKICQFCEGTTLMKGFLGNRVPCIPCEQKGVLPYPCRDCKGLGFLQP